MSHAVSSNPNPLLGDSLRDEAADYLSLKLGSPKVEKRIKGKKLDVYFQYTDFNKLSRLYVEAKDYSRKLTRSQVVSIYADYHGILDKFKPATLLIVTRRGLTTDAQEYVDEEIYNLRHQTIWEIESQSIDLNGYLLWLTDEFDRSGLGSYFIHSGYSTRIFSEMENTYNFGVTPSELSALEYIESWVNQPEDNHPVAVLGGYGSGKTSLANKLSYNFSQKARLDPHARQPILIKLGNISRYSSIEGLLGGFFTHDFPISNFNASNFFKLNEKGRYIIILDGFDEMKHAMSWADFKAQVKSFLRLHNSNSKIILLGRPNSLLNETEERHILRGEKEFGGKWVKLPDWPTFHEIQIHDFTKDQRREFVLSYLSHISEKNNLIDNIENRAEAVNKIADQDPGLYKKPVHSKILIDLAINPSVDLERFDAKFTRGQLYGEFISSIYEREMEKSTRRNISKEQRLTFLRNIAYWLWTKKGTKTSFEIDELPYSMIALFNSDAEEIDDLKRELLSGSILEKKLGDVFYFGHRSFAEFLVADRMKNNSPNSAEHSDYSNAFNDGVRSFLLEDAERGFVRNWAKSFFRATGSIKDEYISFLIEDMGGLKNFVNGFEQSGFWNKLLSPFKDNINFNRRNYESVLKALRTTQVDTFCWSYLWLHRQDFGLLRSNSLYKKLDIEIASALINNLFKRISIAHNSATLRQVDLPWKELVSAFCNIRTDRHGQISIDINHASLITQSVLICKRFGLDITNIPSLSDQRIRTFSVSEIGKNLDNRERKRFYNFLNIKENFSEITAVHLKKRIVKPIRLNR